VKIETVNRFGAIGVAACFTELFLVTQVAIVIEQAGAELADIVQQRRAADFVDGSNPLNADEIVELRQQMIGPAHELVVTLAPPRVRMGLIQYLMLHHQIGNRAVAQQA